MSSAAAAAPMLRVEDLGVRYGALVALEDVSWQVARGEILGIIGPNGAGKSSCYDAATNMVRRSGRVFLDAQDFEDNFLDSYRWDYGGGLRIAFSSGEVARIDVALSEENKPLVYLTFGHTF